MLHCVINSQRASFCSGVGSAAWPASSTPVPLICVTTRVKIVLKEIRTADRTTNPPASSVLPARKAGR